MSLLEELKRRGVLRVGSAYVVGAWLVAQVAEFITETFASPLWVLRTLVVTLSLALAPVLVFSWMFEFTPQGFRRQADLDRAGIVISRAGRRIDYVIAVLLLAAACWLAFSWSQRMRIAEEAAAVAQAPAPSATPTEASAPAAPANSIAVLPFLNLSTAPDSDVLASGIAEELLGVLGRNRGLRVTARSSAFRFKDQDRDLREVGRLLGVRYVLEGSVRLAAQRVKIGTQLVDATSGVQLWSETYDRTLADLFALQEDIAGEVAKALQVVLTANSTAPGNSGTSSIEAHMELLRARQVAATRKIDDLGKAMEMLQRAIVLDPGYADAYVELAYLTGTRAMQTGEELDAHTVLGPLIDKALALNPRSGEALVLRGSLLLEDPAAAERAIREGLTLAPSHARGYELLAQVLARDPARLDEALALLDQAIALDPLSPRNHQVKAILLWDGKGDFERAETHFLRAVDLEPRYRLGMVQLSLLNMSRGSFAAAVDYAERALEIEASAEFRNQLVAQYLNIGEIEEARAANMPASLRAELEILLYEGDTAGGMGRVRAQLHELRPEFGISPAAMILHRDAAAGGDWARNLEIAARVVGYTGELPGEMNGFGFNEAVMVALLRGAGRTAEADRLATWLLEQLAANERRVPAWQRGPINWARAMVLAQTGRDAEALDALEIAFNPARPYWWALLDRNPMFDHLREDPRYKALRARLQDYLAAQRALLAEKRRARLVDAAPGAASPGPG